MTSILSSSSGARGAGGDAVGEHDATERAAGGDLLDLLRGGLQHAECLVDTVDVDALPICSSIHMRAPPRRSTWTVRRVAASR